MAKIKCDAIAQNGCRVGLGFVIRDATGKLIIAAVKKVEGMEMSIAEAKASLFGLTIAPILDFGHVL